MATKNKLIFRIIIAAILALVLALIIFYPKIKPLFSKDEKPAPPAGMKGMGGQGQQPVFASGYVIVPVQMQEMIYSTGTLLPDEEVELSFETSGKIVGIYFTEGTRVLQGKLLAKINDRPLQAQLLKLQAQLKLLEEKEFRQRQLLDRDAISRESYDQVATELQSIQADILLIQARIAETELRAPFNGMVGLRMVSEGAYATTQTKIVRLVKISPLKIEFSISERYADDITNGFPITFQLDGIKNIYSAKVYAIDPKVDVNTRMTTIRALYANRNEELKPGRFVSVKAQLSELKDVIAIPTEAVIPEMDGDRVFIYKNGKAERIRVTSGLRTEALLQIKEGLQFGDTLLTTAILQLRHNLPVKLDTLVTNNQPVNPAP